MMTTLSTHDPQRIHHASFRFDLALPNEYDAYDARQFHGRDAEEVAEQVSETSLRKGVLLDNHPAVIEIRLGPKGTMARCTVDVNGAIGIESKHTARQMAMGMLGLRIDPARFAAFVALDPVFGPLTKKQRGIRVVQSATVFEALTWAIMGQQINTAFAVSLRRTFIRLANRVHSSGLFCYPDAADVASIPIAALTSRQFSRSKAETLIRLSNLIVAGELDLNVSASQSIDMICESLLKIKGIGPWTVNYAMLRGYAHDDCSLHGDVAIRSAFQKLYGKDTRPSMQDVEALLKPFSPHRTMLAAHLWASLVAPSP